MTDLKKKEIVYYTRIFPTLGMYDICECIVRTVEEDYFVAIDKRDKRAYLFNNKALNTTVFRDRKIALKVVREAEKNKVAVSTETYYEEY